MLCVEVASDGSLYVADPQPVDTAGCGLVMVSGIEAASSPFSMTPEQGGEIAGAVLLVWSLAFVFRMLIRSLNVDEQGDSTK